MDYFDYNELIGDDKNDFYPNSNLNQYLHNNEIKPNRVRRYLNINTCNIDNQNRLSSYLLKQNRKYPIQCQLSNNLLKNDLQNKINENYNQKIKNEYKYNNYHNYNYYSNYNDDLNKDKYYSSCNYFHPSNKNYNRYYNFNNYSNDNKHLNTVIHTYKSIYDKNHNLKLSNNILNTKNNSHNLYNKKNRKIMKTSNSFENFYLGNNNLNIILNQNQILKNKYQLNAVSNFEDTEKKIKNLKINNYLKAKNNKNSANSITKNNFIKNNNKTKINNNNFNCRNVNINKNIKQKINIEDCNDEINFSELADDLIKINKSNLSNKKQKCFQKKISVNKKAITIDSASQTVPEETNNILKNNAENKIEKVDVGTDIQKSLLSILDNIENKRKEKENNNKEKEVKKEHSIIENLIKKDTIIKETIVNKDIDNNKNSNEKIDNMNEKNNQMVSSDKNIEEFKNNFSKNESIELDIPGILKNLNLNNNIKESKTDKIVCLVSESSDSNNTGKEGNHIKFDLKKNIHFKFLINENINLCMEVNQKNEIKYIVPKIYDQNSKPKKSIIKNFDKNSIKINNNYISCENLAEEDIIPDLFEDIEGNVLNDDHIKKLESTLEMSIEKSFDRSYDRSSDKSITQSLNPLNSGSISQSYNQFDSEYSTQDNMKVSKKGKGIINKLNRVFSLNSNNGDINEEKGNK